MKRKLWLAIYAWLYHAANWVHRERLQKLGYAPPGWEVKKVEGGYLWRTVHGEDSSHGK